MTGHGLLDRLGWAGLIGIGVLLFCASFYLSALAPLQAEAAQLEAEKTELERHANLEPAATATPKEERVLNAPPLHEAPAMLDRLHGLAEQSKVTMDRPTYKVGQRERSNLHDYDLSLAVRGAYPDIRAFIASLADAGSGLVFDGVSFQRGRAIDPVVDAQVRLTATFEARP